jgi:hypothetical protein
MGGIDMLRHLVTIGSSRSGVGFKYAVGAERRQRIWVWFPCGTAISLVRAVPVLVGVMIDI